MSEISPKPNLTNAAWVTVPTKLTASSLMEFCSNVESVFRLNPYLKIHSWHSTSEQSVYVECENHSSNSLGEMQLQFNVQQLENEICLTYQTGIKQQSFFMVESTIKGAQLSLIDDYGNETDSSLVDKSLTAWGLGLQRFFAHYRYLQYIPFSKGIINRFWIRLNPIARRISYILFVILVIEILLLLLFIIFSTIV